MPKPMRASKSNTRQSKKPPRQSKKKKPTSRTGKKTAGKKQSRATFHAPAQVVTSQNDFDERESLVNDQRRGSKYELTPKVEEVAAIHAFMNDLDCKILDPAVIGEECVESAEALYAQHVQLWLDRDPVLAKSEVRDTGGGLHTILRLDEPIIVSPAEAVSWNAIAKGLHSTLPGDPNLNGIIALTRPVGAMNTKYDPPREVQLLRAGQPVTRTEVLDLSQRLTTQPAYLWMQIFFGGERASQCPFCNEESLGVAGNWQCKCYACGRIDAPSLVYRFYSQTFLKSYKKGHHE